jgi:spermidine synthase
LKYDLHMPSRITRPQVKGYKGKSQSSTHTARSVPVVSNEGGVITLHFGSDFIQSQMLVGDPGFLAFAYTRTMMSFEWFMPQPSEIALIGLGGGSIAKWCHRHHPQSRLTVVEINAHVIAVRRTFGVPKESPRFRIICADGAKFVAKPPNLFDVLLIDCFTTDRLPAELCSQTFYDRCREALADSGLMVVNLCWQKHTRIISRIRKSFSGQVLLSSDDDGNTVVFACKGELLWPKHEDETSLRSRVRRFERKHGLGRAMAPSG